MAYKSADNSSFIHSSKKQGDAPSHPLWPFPVSFWEGGGSAQSCHCEGSSDCEVPGTCTSAAVSDTVGPLETFFPTERLALKSLFAAAGRRSDKPLTSSRLGLKLLGSHIEGSPCKRTLGRMAAAFWVGAAGRPRALMPGVRSGKAATLIFFLENFARSLLLNFICFIIDTPWGSLI